VDTQSLGATSARPIRSAKALLDVFLPQSPYMIAREDVNVATPTLLAAAMIRPVLLNFGNGAQALGSLIVLTVPDSFARDATAKQTARSSK